MNKPLNDAVFALGAGLLPSGKVAIFATRQSGVHRSLDLGKTWSPVWGESLAASIAVSPRFAVDGLVVAGVEGGVIRSEDGGSTWLFHSFGCPQALVASLSITSDYDHSGLILAGTVEDGLYRSIDRGKTWFPSNTGAYIPRITAVHVHNGHRCLVGTDCGLFLSSNEGKTWDDQIGHPIDAEVSAITSDYATMLIGTESKGIFAWDSKHRIWISLPQSVPNEETITLAIIGEAASQKEIVAITSTLIQWYCLENGETSTVMTLVRTTSLPVPAMCAAVFTTGTIAQAFIGGVNGEIVVMAI